MPSLSERRGALILAMRQAAGPHDALPGQWVGLAQRREELGQAMHAIFKRMPAPHRLGRLLSEHIGLEAGGFKLHARYSRAAKAWRYAARTPQEIEEVERKAGAAETAREERRAQLEEEWAQADIRDRHRDARRAERLAAEIPSVLIRVAQPGALGELAPAPVSGPIEQTRPVAMQPSHADAYLTSVKYDGDGYPRTEYTRDRDGNPIPARTAPQAQAPKPVQAAEPPKSAARIHVQPRTANDPRLPRWVREGRQPTKAELAGRHQQFERPADAAGGDEWFIQACEARNRWGKL